MIKEQTEQYNLQLKDFIPFYGIKRYLDRVPKDQNMGVREILNSYKIILGQTVILSSVAISLEKLLK